MRGRCRRGGAMLLRPVVRLHVSGSRGKLRPRRRPLWKDILPGRWDAAVGGMSAGARAWRRPLAERCAKRGGSIVSDRCSCGFASSVPTGRGNRRMSSGRFAAAGSGRAADWTEMFPVIRRDSPKHRSGRSHSRFRRRGGGGAVLIALWFRLPAHLPGGSNFPVRGRSHRVFTSDRQDWARKLRALAAA